MNLYAVWHRTRMGKRALLGSWLTTTLACLGVALPKCPLCLAAYLCLFGMSAGSAHALAALGLPLCLSAIGLCTLATALFVTRRSKCSAACRAAPLDQPAAVGAREPGRAEMSR